MREPTQSNRLNSVENELSVVGTKVDALQVEVSGLVKSFDDYVKFENESGKTNWATIAAWTAVAITMTSAMLYHNSLSLEPLKIVNYYQEQKITDIEHKQKDIDAKINTAILGN